MSNEVHSLTGAYAVDALDRLERVRFERHLDECPDCGSEVRSLRAAAGELAQTVATPPPVMVRQRVLAEIRTVRPLAPVPAPVLRAEQSRARRFPQLAVAAVAAVVLVIGGGVAALKPWETRDNVAAVAVPQRVMDASDARTQSVSFDNGARATLYHSKSVNRSVLVTDSMANAPAGKVYELWYQTAKGAFVPAGMVTEGGNQTVVLHGELGTSKGVGITVEPAKGSLHPTTAPIALFHLNQSV